MSLEAWSPHLPFRSCFTIRKRPLLPEGFPDLFQGGTSHAHFSLVSQAYPSTWHTVVAGSTKTGMLLGPSFALLSWKAPSPPVESNSGSSQSLAQAVHPSQRRTTLAALCSSSWFLQQSSHFRALSLFGHSLFTCFVCLTTAGVGGRQDILKQRKAVETLSICGQTDLVM